jgi:hypothetical protein
MNFRHPGYLICCAVALIYLVVANGRGYIPFAGALTRSAASGNSGGHVFIFHK